MEAEIRTLEDIFSGSVRLLVPLFQRPYVWEQGKQWEPLWEDVRAVAEQLRDRLSTGISPKKAQQAVPAHFMGAVVLQRLHTAIGELDQFSVIDGQQRLTTLQLLADAAHAAVDAAGDTDEASLLSALVQNTKKVKADEDRFKVWPTNVDREAFREVMEAPPPVRHDGLASPRARVTQAHRYFSRAIVEWLADSATPAERQLTASCLATVLLGKLTLVVIELKEEENAQLIFETLNARNTPLLSSDLVKNVIFRRIEEEDAGDVEALYAKYWRKLDDDRWRQNIAQGRLVRPRLDVFLHYWLTMHAREAVTSHEVFSKVREMLGDTDAPTKVLASIAAHAARYDSLATAPAATVLGTFRYRVIEVMQADVVTPFLLWLLDPTQAPVPQTEVDLALTSLESWAVRRMLLRLTTKDLNKLVIDLLQTLAGAERAEAGTVTCHFLARQTTDSRLWPSDAAVREALISAELYRTISRGRLRMILEAIEDQLRTEYSERRVDRGVYTIEHILPQTWKTHWPVDEADPSAAPRRSRAVHVLGNLTLVTKKLNPALSNSAWSTKRDALGKHSVLRLNHLLLDEAGDAWDEAGVDARTTRLVDAVLAVWSRPQSA